MRLSLDSIQVLDAIDRNGSFALAASELHRVPSAITYSVKQLEEGLGVELFDRKGHRAVLTDAGRELLAEGRHLLRAAADLECRVQQVAKGWESELRIAVDTVIGPEKLYGVIEEFYREATGTRLRLATEVLAGTWDALAAGRADLAIGASGDPPSGRTYATRVIGRIQMVFAAAFASIEGTVSVSCPESRPTVRGGKRRELSATLTARWPWIVASSRGIGDCTIGWNGAAANTIWMRPITREA